MMLNSKHSWHFCSIFHYITHFVLKTHDAISNSNSFSTLQYHIFNEIFKKIFVLRALIFSVITTPRSLGNVRFPRWEVRNVPLKRFFTEFPNPVLFQLLYQASWHQIQIGSLEEILHHLQYRGKSPSECFNQELIIFAEELFWIPGQFYQQPIVFSVSTTTYRFN